MIISELKALDLLTLKFNLSDKDAREVVSEFRKIDEGIGRKVKEEIIAREDIFLTKDDKVELIEKVELTKTDLTEKIEFTKTDLIERIELTKTDLIERIEKTRSDMIKWMFLFWIGQLAAIFGMLKIFFA